MREEIKREIRPDEDPTFRLHSSKCSYVMAWIYEMMRHCSPSPMLIPHQTTQQVEFDNCIIPAGVTVFFNVWEVSKAKNSQQNQTENFLFILIIFGDSIAKVVNCQFRWI